MKKKYEQTYRLELTEKDLELIYDILDDKVKNLINQKYNSDPTKRPVYEAFDKITDDEINMFQKVRNKIFSI